MGLDEIISDDDNTSRLTARGQPGVWPKPAELAVQQATKLELILNMKTAKTLGITFPLSLLGRADEVIE